VLVEGRPDPGPQKQQGADYSVACPNVLRTLGIPLLQGREFTLADTVGASGVALVDEAMAAASGRARRSWASASGPSPTAPGWALGGVGSGIAASLGLLRFLRAALYGVGPTDPAVLGAVSLLLVAVALGASYLPARRGARVDPVVALRCE
jgi:hypothetical protein